MTDYRAQKFQIRFGNSYNFNELRPGRGAERFVPPDEKDCTRTHVRRQSGFVRAVNQSTMRMSVFSIRSPISSNASRNASSSVASK